MADTMGMDCDPCERFKAITRFGYYADILPKARALIEEVAKAFQPKELEVFAATVFDYDYFDPFVHLVHLQPELINSSGRSRYTVLHCAAEYHPVRVPKLLELGASVNVLSEYNRTPLDGAYWYRRIGTVRNLLRCGASVMIGQKHWIKDTLDKSDSARIILRAYYLALISHIVNHSNNFNQEHHPTIAKRFRCLFRRTVEMLV